MYKYNKHNATIEKLDISIDKTSPYSVSPVDEFIYNGAIITPLINVEIFQELDILIKKLIENNMPLYMQPDYLIEEDILKDGSNVYAVGNEFTWKNFPIKFNIKDVLSNLYIVESISYQGEGKEPYYLLSNLNGETKILYKRHFNMEFNLQDTLLFL